jgi:sterol-4alpha-carboxylate 3-dehydrogenase (decarboxylating)
MVIGGCGFLGHHVVDLLLRSYTCSLSVVDLRCSKNRRPDSDGVRYIEADITDTDRLFSVFADVEPDVVIHTASPAVQAQDKVAHALFKKVNIDGTRAVVEACRKTGVKALVYTSSASVISDNRSDLINADERWPLIRGKQQTEYYSETKVRNNTSKAGGRSQRRLTVYQTRPKPKRSSWLRTARGPPG